MTKLAIDIWSDVMCPWCLVGHAQLARALEALDGEIDAEIRWHPFELNPAMPGEGVDQADYLAQRTGRSASEMADARARIEAMAQAAGTTLVYSGPEPAPRPRMWNTFAAHRLLAHALDVAGPEVQTRLKLALFTAHFRERRNVSDLAVLLDVAVACGLDRAAADVALADEALAARVRAEEARGIDLNITGVPAVVVAGKYLIPGAQESSVYVDALRRVAEREAATA